MPGVQERACDVSSYLAMTAEFKPRIEVLLATYNGGLFLRQQVDSILGQTYENLTILARDDGSQDGTRLILAEFAARYPDRFHVLSGVPTGHPKLNFSALLAASSGDYVAFSDQDDVWRPDKIERSLEAMRRLESRSKADVPLLIFSDLTVADQSLNEIHPSLWAMQHHRPDRVHQFARLLTQNIVTGSTMLMNRRLCEMALPMHPKAFMHDWWIALVACAFGNADYLKEPTVLYRQHTDNVLGAAGGEEPPRGLPKWRYHQKRREQWENSERQAEGFLATHGSQVRPQILRLLEAYVRCETSSNRLVRVWTLLRHRFLLQDLRPNLAILLYLFDMNRAKQDFPVNPV